MIRKKRAYRDLNDGGGLTKGFENASGEENENRSQGELRQKKRNRVIQRIRRMKDAIGLNLCNGQADRGVVPLRIIDAGIGFYIHRLH